MDIHNTTDDIFDAIDEKDIDLAVSLFPLIDSSELYDSDVFEDGLLYALFPRNQQRDTYDAEFSTKCLQRLIKAGYTPWNDRDVCSDFFTEAARRHFKDFCGVVTKDTETNAKMIFTFLIVSGFYWADHFEILHKNDKAHQIEVDGKLLLEHAWGKIGLDLPYLLDDRSFLEEHLLTMRNWEGSCNILRDGERILRAMDHNVVQNLDGARDTENLLLAHIQAFRARVDKEAIQTHLAGISKDKNQMRKM